MHIQLYGVDQSQEPVVVPCQQLAQRRVCLGPRRRGWAEQRRLARRPRLRVDVRIFPFSGVMG